DPRAGNIAGLQDVLKRYRVLEVMDVGAEYPSSSYSAWRATLRARHIPTYALRTGAIARVGGASIAAVGPGSVFSNPVDSVGMVKISLPGRSILLSGTASVTEQRDTVFRTVSLRAGLLVSDGPLDSSFVAAVHPRAMADPLATVKGPIRIPLATGTITRLAG
ncbi:MAG: hypothetical protein ACRDFX_05265, partial [Chloroflexota bacterium]